VVLAFASTADAQAGRETFTATASVTTAGGASVTAPVTIVVDSKTPPDQAAKLHAAFNAGGVAGLRKALDGVAPTGTVQIGKGTPTPSRITLERTTDRGRLLTIVTDKPIVFLGGGLPDAKPKEGYDLAVVDLDLDAKGGGSGTLAPAAKVSSKQGAFVVDDYGPSVVRLTDIKRGK
jgi:hypothetical protein